MAQVTVKQLLDAGAHFGHNTRYWNPKMGSYIFDSRNKIHIIDLRKTQEKMHEAMNFISSLASRRGKILFVGTKRAASKSMKEEASRCGMPFVSHRWLGGMLTNYKTVKQSIKRLKDIEVMQEEGSLSKFVKKEQLEIQREKDRLEKTLGGIKNMNGLPDALFIVDTRYESIAIDEAKKLGIPVVAVVDTNNAYDKVDYLIPGNDDSIKAIRLYAATAADSILEGKASMQLGVAKEEKQAESPESVSKEETVSDEKVEKELSSENEAATTIEGKESSKGVEAVEAEKATKKVAKKTTKKVAKKTTKKVAKKTTKKVAKKTTKKAAAKDEAE